MSRERRKRKTTESQSSGSPAWMATFSDMMTLLLTFFILLYSISTVDVQKFKDISYSLQAVLMGEGQPTIFEGQDPTTDIPLEEENHEIEDIIDPSTIKETTLEMYTQVKDYIQEQGLEAEVTVSLNRSGVFVDIKEAILFEPGRAELKTGGKEILDNLEGLFLQFENEIVVEGHTDNVPIKTANYPTNWELSVDRAVRVVRYLCEVKKVPEKRLSAIGYGEYQPIAHNDTPQNRALNRRVNLLIIMDEGEV
ncbi:flagellar motor protein MotB [Alkalibacter mobilis]|uniref:flagellar motor protein MotB n=1 Tax=Alkalibacter mobilis TaxID=2787712 RepID=UPI00189F3A72|nr:flagellar motor protein MotB [Alkalibacter mobilis]MBF7096313.1 OmpA family protein [Alkalibacter mobilis]